MEYPKRINGTPKTSARSDKEENLTEVNYPKTPYNIRTRIKKQIANFNVSGENSDFSDDDSDFRISDEESGSTAEETEDSESEEEESGDDDDDDFSSDNDTGENKSCTSKSPSTRVEEIIPSYNLFKKRRLPKYIIKTDEYFSSHSSRKIVTSNNTLDKLKTPKLEQGEVQQLILKSHASEHHDKHLKKLEMFNRSCFLKWLGLLHEGFNLLFYGLGSKRDILLTLHEQFLKDQPVIIVNGFFPSLTIKNIMDSILIDVFESTCSPANPQEACDTIALLVSQHAGLHLYILLNNIDSGTLRNRKSQNILARLSSIQNVHLVATIDHICAPIIWDQNKMSKFNFIWWDVTTFKPYLNETSFEDSLLVQHSGALALSSLSNVFMSLTKNARSIYLIIVKHQLENRKNQQYEGLLFKDLYWACREAFLVSSDLALRAQLTEFVDHKMVKFKRSVSGGEYLIIPLQNALLQQFLDEQSS